MSYKLGEKDVVNNIDVVIVMDCTGSMQKWINAAKDTVLEAFHNIREKYPESFIRLGLVCYRDIGDYEPFIISPITESIETIQDVLKGVRATGGNDEAEDIAGAFEKNNRII
jgi:Mg-chelatase subunit ChlD